MIDEGDATPIAAPVMERCPTCRAIYRGGETCGRCQTDLRQILAVEATASRHRRQAIEALKAGRPWTADAHARSACRTHRCAESIRVAALASLACRSFPEAVTLWMELGRELPQDD